MNWFLKNVARRFNKEYLPVLNAVSVFYPLNVLRKDSPGFKSYGKSQIIALCDNFTKYQVKIPKERMFWQKKYLQNKDSWSMTCWSWKHGFRKNVSLRMDLARWHHCSGVCKELLRHHTSIQDWAYCWGVSGSYCM